MEQALDVFFSSGGQISSNRACRGTVLHFDLGSDFDCDDWSSVVFKLLLQRFVE